MGPTWKNPMGLCLGLVETPAQRELRGVFFVGEPLQEVAPCSIPG